MICKEIHDLSRSYIGHGGHRYRYVYFNTYIHNTKYKWDDIQIALKIDHKTILQHNRNQIWRPFRQSSINAVQYKL